MVTITEKMLFETYDTGETALRLGDVIKGDPSWRFFPLYDSIPLIVQAAKYEDHSIEGTRIDLDAPSPKHLINDSISDNPKEAALSEKYFMVFKQGLFLLEPHNATKLTLKETNAAGEILEDGLELALALPKIPDSDDHTNKPCIFGSSISFTHGPAGVFGVFSKTPEIIIPRDYVPSITLQNTPEPEGPTTSETPDAGTTTIERRHGLVILPKPITEQFRLTAGDVFVGDNSLYLSDGIWSESRHVRQNLKETENGLEVDYSPAQNSEMDQNSLTGKFFLVTKTEIPRGQTIPNVWAHEIDTQGQEIKGGLRIWFQRPTEGKHNPNLYLVPKGQLGNETPYIKGILYGPETLEV